MFVAGIANVAMLVGILAAWLPEASWSQHPFICTLITAIFLLYAVMTALVFRGALKMLNRENYAASRVAAICSTLSFNIVSVPVGIWALVRLSRPEVKALFPEVPTASAKGPRHLLSGLLALLMCAGFFFGFSFQAKMGGTAAGQTKLITVGVLDPLYVSESGPSGFSTHLNFLSWSFFAVVIAGVSFGALWRISREDQGKIPRDPAWWRDWWKQVGIWCGLILYSADGFWAQRHTLRKAAGAG